MKYYVFLICILSLSCKSKPVKNDEKETPNVVTDSILVHLNSGKTDLEGSCATISNSLESDSSYNKLLRQYLCSNLYGNDGDISADKLTLLAKRPSFHNMILLFYTGGDNFDKISFYGEKSQLPELRKNLLFGMGDCCPDEMSSIADTLLKIGSSDGLELLWGKADLHKLPSLNNYLTRVDTGNFFVYAELAAFFHNNNNPVLRDTFLNKARHIKDYKQEYKSLDSLILNNKQFDISAYNDAIFGGTDGL